MAALALSEPDGKRATPNTAGAALLTSRQAEVVKLVRHGLTAKEVARRLGISKRTVEAHLSEARRRAGVSSTIALVGSAIAIAGDCVPGSASTSFCSENAGISEQETTGTRAAQQPDQRQRGRPTVMTDDMIGKARLLLSSHSISDIARRLNVSRTTIYAHMSEIRGLFLGFSNDQLA